ncbi:hypothetical protein Tco_0017666 [Tanacetum coccineum]
MEPVFTKTGGFGSLFELRRCFSNTDVELSNLGKKHLSDMWEMRPVADAMGQQVQLCLLSTRIMQEVKFYFTTGTYESGVGGSDGVSGCELFVCVLSGIVKRLYRLVYTAHLFLVIRGEVSNPFGPGLHFLSIIDKIPCRFVGFFDGCANRREPISCESWGLLELWSGEPLSVCRSCDSEGWLCLGGLAMRVGLCFLASCMRILVGKGDAWDGGVIFRTGLGLECVGRSWNSGRDIFPENPLLLGKRVL